MEIMCSECKELDELDVDDYVCYECETSPTDPAVVSTQTIEWRNDALPDGKAGDIILISTTHPKTTPAPKFYFGNPQDFVWALPFIDYPEPFGETGYTWAWWHRGDTS